MGLPGFRSGGASLLVAVLLLLGPGVSRAGHELSYYPAFYPSDVTLTTMRPDAAGKALKDNKLHAYLGEAPTFDGPIPPQLHAVESLGGYVVLKFSPASPKFGTPKQRCQLARQVIASLAGGAASFVAHPYPVTPFHADYLEQVDRAELAKAAASKPGKGRTLTLRATGELAQQAARAGWPVADAAWDAELVQVPLEGLLSSVSTQFSGILGPPWIKEGWFHAWLLLGGDSASPAARSLFEKLARGEYKDLVGRYNLERQLVEALQAPCTQAVVGYTVRRELYNDEYTFGVENVSWDSARGMNDPVYFRTVKLKDFPWNGPLFLGIGTRAEAAWNPVSGFSDPAGRAVWSLLADDAFMTMPGNASWVPNRIDTGSSVLGNRPGGYEVPAEAVLPEVGTGILKPVGSGKRSSAKILYRVLASPYQDGSEMEMADALYPYIFAYRWAGTSGGLSDPTVAAATSLMRERIVGILPLGTEKRIDLISDIQVPRWFITIEVYLNDGAADPRQTAALAPPWSAIPWHLGVLMEEAVQRGIAAFSKEEAARRKVPWLDVVRDPLVGQKLRDLLGSLEGERFRPAALVESKIEPAVTPEGAAQRWANLKAFVKENGHFLDTNGPYSLKDWKGDSVKFLVVRDFKYAVGIGTFDGFADPPLARVKRMQRERNDLWITAELDKIVRYGRNLKVITEPLKRGAAKGFRVITPRARMVLIGPDGQVAATNRPDWREDGRFSAALPKDLAPGSYRALAAVAVDDNSAETGIGSLRIQVGSTQGK